MLTIQAARNPKPASEPASIGLALAGGGPQGGIYEIGALLALEELLEGVEFTNLDVYVGVSSGGMVASGLAKSMGVAKLCRIFIRDDSVRTLFAPEEIFFRPAFNEFIRRALSVPEVLTRSVLHFLAHPLDLRLSNSLSRFGRVIPTGVFNNDAISEFFSYLYGKGGRTDDFRDLPHRLYLVAVDLNTAEPVVFGDEGFDHIPISQAIQASTALPGLYSPVEIEGRYYVDGALRKTMHASRALEDDATLVFCINPMIPFDAREAAQQGTSRFRNLTRGGLPVVLSQTFRTLIYSRMVIGMNAYTEHYPESDVVLMMPDRDDPKMFFTNVFSYANRRHVCEHAYQTTRGDLIARREELTPVLARHGIRIREEAIDDPDPHYWTASKPVAAAL